MEPIRPEFSSTTSTRTDAIPGRSCNGALEGNSFGKDVLVGRRFEAEPQGLAFYLGMQPGVVTLDEEDVQLVHPAARLFLHSQVRGRDIQLELRHRADGRDIRRDADFAGLDRPPDRGLEAIFECLRFFREHIAGPVAKRDSTSAGELHGDGMVLVVSRSLGRKAHLVNRAPVFHDAVKSGGQFAGAADGSPAGGGGDIANRALDGMQILAHFRRNPSRLHVAPACRLARAACRCRGGRIVGCRLRQLHVAMLHIGRNGATLQLRNVERVHRRMRIVHGFLHADRKGVRLLGALVDSHLLVLPVGEDVVTGNPHQVLVPGYRRQMASHLRQNDQRGTRRIVAHGQQLRVDRLRGVGHIGVVAVYGIQVVGAVNFVELLAVAGLLLPGLRNGKRRWRKRLQPGLQRRVIAGRFH